MVAVLAPNNFISLVLQHFVHSLGVLCPGGLYHTLDLHHVNAGVEPGPLVINVLDGRPDPGQLFGEEGEAARAVAEGGNESNQPTVRRQPAVNDPAEGGGVNVSPAQRHHHFLALQLGDVQGPPRQDASQTCGTPSLHHTVLVLHQAQHSQGNLLLVHQLHPVHVVPRHLKRVATHHGHRQAIGQGGLVVHRSRRVARLQSSREGGAVVGLHANHLNLWLQSFESQGHASYEPSAPNGNHHNLRVWNLLQDLNGHGACTSYDFGVVVSVDVLELLVLGVGLGVLHGGPDVRAVDHNVGPQLAALLHLRDRGHCRHEASHRDSQRTSVVG
mmetsp:Transcript_15412/g.22665  ORF Transcript_15412/g.22665 Transcript_15412/m.22665 type:complete len:329 (-) Transcript_15412:489-1475(-)